MTTTPEPESAREIVQMRAIAAPRALVWQALTDPKHVDKWWGPTGFTNTTHAMDVRVGGEWRFDMQHAEYGTFHDLIVYLEVQPPERLVMDHSNADGTETFRSVITLEDLGTKTLVTMHAVFPTVAARNKVIVAVDAIEGGHQTLARLAAFCAEQG